jgi:hypothetical protein
MRSSDRLLRFLLFDFFFGGGTPLISFTRSWRIPIPKCSKEKKERVWMEYMLTKRWGFLCLHFGSVRHVLVHIYIHILILIFRVSYIKNPLRRTANPRGESVVREGPRRHFGNSTFDNWISIRSTEVEIPIRSR